MTRPRVLVIGAGPAGLAAASRLLQRAPELAVRMIQMGHHVGGKAASRRDGAGRVVDHGWHMVLGFYDRMRALMRWANVDPVATLASMGGHSAVFEPSTGGFATLEVTESRIATARRFLGFDAIPLADRLNLGRFITESVAMIKTGEDLRRHDDICFTTWAIERGLRPHITRYSIFRAFREGYFNFPEEISAYHALKTLDHMNTPETAEASVARGSYSERIWQPIADKIIALGGSLEQYTMAVDWVFRGRTVSAVTVARPDSSGHDDGKSAWKPARIRPLAGTLRTIDDFDWVISTIPHAVFVTMNEDNRAMWESPYFRRLGNLRSVATISMTVHTEKPVMPQQGPVFGFPAPLGICTNMKPYRDDVKNDPSIGAALEFVGQEPGFESWSDDDIIKATLDNFSARSEVGDIRAAGIRYVELHRNRANHDRLLLCEPGVQQFRPGPRTPFHNLFLAGDWVANPVDVICMEGAIASGEQAADALLEALHGR